MDLQKANEIYKIGEDLSAKFLERKGYSILHKNYRVKGGEIDLIAHDRDSLVFIEVKTRSKHSIKQAMMSISYTKRKRITYTAERYIIQHPDCVKSRFRFDVIFVWYFRNSDTYKIEHLENAFHPVF